MGNLKDTFDASMEVLSEWSNTLNADLRDDIAHSLAMRLATGDSKVLRDALLRTHWVLCHPSVRGAAVMASVHGMPYTGPVWNQQPEIKEAFKLAGLPEELPLPEYSEAEVGVFPKKYQTVQVGNTTVTEHSWESDPDPDDAVFLGTYSDCYAWLKENQVTEEKAEEYYVTRTGRVIDNGEEAAFFAQFD